MAFGPSDVESVRIDNQSTDAPARDLRAVADEMGLGWQKARQLWSTGLLSFDPDAAGWCVDAARRAEFMFLGQLAAAGLSADAITAMVRGLRRPYAYDPDRIYYDWRLRSWRTLPANPDPEEAFFAMLARLDPRREETVLGEIRELVESALDLARGRRELYRHEAPAAVSREGRYVLHDAEHTERDCAS